METNNPLVSVHNGYAVVTSLDIARIFETPHEEILEHIENCFANIYPEAFPHQLNLVDSDGNPVKAWEMTQNGFELVWDWWLEDEIEQKGGGVDALGKLQNEFAQVAEALACPQEKENPYGNG